MLGDEDWPFAGLALSGVSADAGDDADAGLATPWSSDASGAIVVSGLGSAPSSSPAEPLAPSAFLISSGRCRTSILAIDASFDAGRDGLGVGFAGVCQVDRQ